MKKNNTGFQKIFIAFLMIASCHIVQAQNYSYITKSFFNTNKTYYIESYVDVITGTNNYKKGDASITINNKTITIKDGQGRKDTYKIVGDMKDCKVYSEDGDATINMYTLDNEDAIQAIKKNNGQIIIYYYVYNYSVSKYVFFEFYRLYSD